MWREPPGGGCKTPTYIFAMVLLALLALTNVATAEDESMGPVFVKEPPNRVDFSNGTGAVVECQARGNPQPDIIWVRGDGTAVGDVPGLRQVLPNGNLVFPPFRAEDYRQEVHAQVYSCLARSPAGSVHSRDVNVRAVVGQRYAVNVMDEHVLRGNAAIIKCHIPSFVAEFVEVDSWIEDNTTDIYPSPDYDGKYLVLPSGELHIRDVGPEDGYKTYQCRTKHRLTGETRLSATKGRLVITEPVGSVRPKFPSMDNINGLSTSSSDNIPLLCPAQGFPVPSYRARGKRTSKNSFYRRHPWLQSTGRWFASPVVPSTGVPRSFAQNRSAVCDQSFQRSTTPGVSEPPWMARSHCCVPLRASLSLCTKPVGSVRPKFPVMSNINGFMTYQGGSMTLLCAAQGFPVPSHRTRRQCETKISNDRRH